MGEESHVAVILAKTMKNSACHTACHSVSQRVTLDCVLFAYPTLICAETICKACDQPQNRSVSHTVSHRVTLFCVLGYIIFCFSLLFLILGFLVTAWNYSILINFLEFRWRGEPSLSRKDARDAHAAQPTNATMRRNGVW